MNRKKIIYSLLFIGLIGGVFFLYNSFNGNPLSKYLAKRELASYLTENYPNEEFHIDKGFYNFKFAEYTFDVQKIGETETYEFNVQGFIRPKVVWDGIYYAHLDEPLMEKLAEEASQEIIGLLANKLDVVVEIEVYLEVLQGTYAKDTKWNKLLTLENPLELHIVLDSTDATKEDVFEAAQIIQDTLNKANYDYDHVTINGNIIDGEGKEFSETGYVKYYTSFEPNEKLKLDDVEEEGY